MTVGPQYGNPKQRRKHFVSCDTDLTSLWFELNEKTTKYDVIIHRTKYDVIGNRAEKFLQWETTIESGANIDVSSESSHSEKNNVNKSDDEKLNVTVVDLTKINANSIFFFSI